MGKTGRIALVIGVGGTLWALAPAAGQEATFTPLGKSFSAYCISPEGAVVGGAGPDGAYIWTKEKGFTMIPPSAEVYPSWANGISSGAALVVGHGWGPEFPLGFWWTPGDGAKSIGVLPGGPPFHHQSSAAGASADGQWAAGTSSSWIFGPDEFRAVRWSRATQKLEGLPFLNPEGGSSGWALSADGSVLVGAASLTETTGRAVRWVGSAPPEDLGTLPGYNSTNARDVSHDGTVVVGVAGNAGPGHAFRWTPAGGMIDLGALPGGATDQSLAYTCSADGALVAGYSNSPIGSQGYIWDAAHGMRSLHAILTSHGLDLADWRVGAVHQMSADGTVLVGSCGQYSNPGEQGFIATIPPLCRPDCDTNGILDIDDFLCFQLRFAQGHVYADYNIDGILDIDDFLAFHLAFAVGCG